MSHWRYGQPDGRIIFVEDDGSMQLKGIGFAGNDYRPDTNKTGIKGFNNPGAEFVQYIGPLPKGWYTIGKPFDHPKLGKFVMALTPDPENDMRGRDAFFCHGASQDPAKRLQSSEGCICADRPTREDIANSGTNRLEVV
jgi:hypothetical protein